MAAVDLFLEIDGITGDSVDATHRGAIDAVAFSWSEYATQASGGGGGGFGFGKVNIGELQVVMRTSTASPLLLVACASGHRFATAKLTVRRSGGDRRQRDFLVIGLTDVQVSGYRVGANESGDDDTPTDQVSLTFGTILVEVQALDGKGAVGHATKGGWDAIQGVPLPHPVTPRPPDPVGTKAARKPAAARPRAARTTKPA
jgi:type VI secretion system secreted protein Hcp